MFFKYIYIWKATQQVYDVDAMICMSTQDDGWTPKGGQVVSGLPFI